MIQTEIATRALYRAVRTKLLDATSGFNNRVYIGFHPFSADIDDQIFPYVVLVFVGGGDADWSKNKDAELNIQVSCFSDDPDESEAGALVIDNALDGFGSQASSIEKRLDGVTWDITSVTAGRAVSGQELFSNARVVSMDGKVYRVTMEL